MTSCKLMERESRLYKSLLNSLNKDREKTNIAYAIAKIPQLARKFKNLEYENGEPTFESFSKVFDLEFFNEGSLSVESVKQKFGLVDSKDNLKSFKDAQEAIDIALDINTSEEEAIADVVKTDDGFGVKVEKKTVTNSHIPSELEFNNSLNNRLLNIMKRAGFNASIDSSIEHGIFDPLNARKTSDGLISVIRIAKGQQGEEAFPEEFAHFAIEGLASHSLINRYINSITEEMIEDILGEDYGIYYSKYNGSSDKLRKEAAGKLLASYITGKPLNVQKRPTSLLSRIWNLIKGIFGNISERDVNEAIEKSNNLASQISDLILKEDIVPLISKENVLKGDTLYKMAAGVAQDKKLAEAAIETLSKQLNLSRLKSKDRKYKDEDLAIMKELQDSINEKKYVASCFAFLEDGLERITNMNNELERLYKDTSRSASDLTKLRIVSRILREIQDFSEGYSPIISSFSRATYMKKRGELDMSDSDAKRLQDRAVAINTILNNIESNYKELRFNTVYNYLKIYWGEDKIIKAGKDKTTRLTLELILQQAEKDISTTDRWLSALSDSSDILSNLVAKAVKVSHENRDKILRGLISEIRVAHKNFGEKTDFMYERDSEGKPTGLIISDRNISAFLKDRREYIQKLKEEGYKDYKLQLAIEAWERSHTDEVITYEDPVHKVGKRVELLASKALYPSNALEGLSDKQRTYYNKMMEYKKALDMLLPEKYARTYKAVQIRNDASEAVLNNIADPKKAAKMVVDNLKDNFLRRTDDTEFGDTAEEVSLDFAGRIVNNLPIYYTRSLKNMDRLSTDFTSSLIAYAGMAVNYSEMSKVVDVLELTKDLANDRKVKQVKGGNTLMESYKVLGNMYKKAYSKRGKDTAIGGRLEDFFDAVMYNKSKLDEGTLLGMDQAKTLDAIKGYSGDLGLGLNLFSGISNVTMGKMQIFIEAMGGEYFGYKNSQVGKKNYYALLPEYLGELNASVKKSKLGLLIDKFDALEEFYGNLKEDKLGQGTLSRLIKNHKSLYIFNNMGEHYLHARTMLAMLDRYKVKQTLDSGATKEISLFDALEVKEIKDAEGNILRYDLGLKGNVTKIDGSEITEDDFTSLKLKIGRVNQSLNGAFNDEDKGAIHKYALGRLAMQFRQWMPAHYNRRFASKYYDTILDQEREGYYRTLGRFSLDLIKDLAKFKFEVGTHWNELTPHEIANIRRALTELAIFGMLSIGTALMGKAKDHKGKWSMRMLYYQLKRMELETGASVPWPTMVDNMYTLIKSPAAAITTINHITDLLKFQNMFVEKESGRYKGMSEYKINVLKLVPAYGQINKVLDVSDEDYMFTIFNQ